MKFHTSRSQLLFVAFLLVSVGVPVVGFAQNWQDPALQQPVRQYFSGNRYPLTGMTKAVTSATPPARSEVKRIDVPSKSAPSNKKTSDFEPPAKRKAATKKTTGGSKKPAVDKKTAGAKTSSKKKKSDKKADKEKSKPKADPHHPVKTWDIYRDRASYPIDPRKPCSVCKREVGQCNCGCQCAHRGIGNQGMPWQDIEPGGRTCGKKNCSNKRPEYSVYWPKPLSARRENRDGCCQACGHARCRCRKVNDLFDHLANFSLIDYQRKDNAYCGSGADPYGCLGESRTENAGIGYSLSSEAATRYPLDIMKN